MEHRYPPACCKQVNHKKRLLCDNLSIKAAFDAGYDIGRAE
ncbi:MAG: hypothetical protein Q8M56_09410 [Desulfobacterales bacterium]|nr:hypothetical protein [Desulfobacterales bacterium]